jgi:hypothetical protein
MFFVVDRSGGGGSGLNQARPQIVQALSVLPEEAEFGIFIFDRGLLAFPDGPKPAFAQPDVVNTAIEFVRTVRGGAGTCPLPALLAALEMAALSTRDHTYVGWLVSPIAVMT